MLPHRSRQDRLVERVARVCARAQDPLGLFESVAGLVRAEVPYASAGWILIDPDTLLINAVYGEDVDHALHRDLIACELTEDDLNKFWELAREGVAAVALSATTGGNLAQSTRWARIYGPHGYGDELRAVFATGKVAWGHACLTRQDGDPFFTAEEVDLVAAVAPHVGNGIRTCYLLGDLTGGEPGESPAMVVLDDEGAVVSLTAQAATWLGDPTQVDATIVLHEVAQQARALAAGTAGNGTERSSTDGPASGSSVGAAPTAPLDQPAMARARSRDGEWLVVRGVRLTDGDGNGQPGTTALVLEPARRADLAPLMLGLNQLTDREREVTQLLLHGMSTSEIAQELWISPETLRGHVKSVFAKLGVSSRPELAALLSHEPRSRVRPAEPAGRRSR